MAAQNSKSPAWVFGIIIPIIILLTAIVGYGKILRDVEENTAFRRTASSMIFEMARDIEWIRKTLDERNTGG